MNDDEFGEMKSADSLDESFSDSSISCSEVDSNPVNDYCVRTINVETPLPTRGRPRTRGGGSMSRARTRAGRRGRGIRTRGSNKMPPNKRLSSTISDDESNSSGDEGSSPDEDGTDSELWKNNQPNIKGF